QARSRGHRGLRPPRRPGRRGGRLHRVDCRRGTGGGGDRRQQARRPRRRGPPLHRHRRRPADLRLRPPAGIRGRARRAVRAGAGAGGGQSQPAALAAGPRRRTARPARARPGARRRDHRARPASHHQARRAVGHREEAGRPAARAHRRALRALRRRRQRPSRAAHRGRGELGAEPPGTRPARSRHRRPRPRRLAGAGPPRPVRRRRRVRRTRWSTGMTTTAPTADRLRALLGGHAHIVSAEEQAGRFPAELFAAVMATGLAEPVVERAPGAVREFCDNVAAVAETWLALGESVHLQTLVALTVARHATPELRDRLVPALTAGRVLGANCISEPAAGSDMSAIALRAERTGAGFTLTGTKTWAGHAPLAGVLVVYARTRDAGLGGLTRFAVDPATAGVTVAPAARKRSAPALPSAAAHCGGPH